MLDRLYEGCATMLLTVFIVLFTTVQAHEIEDSFFSKTSQDVSHNSQVAANLLTQPNHECYVLVTERETRMEKEDENNAEECVKDLSIKLKLLSTQNVTELSLSGYGLTDIPREVTSLLQLKKLDVSCNKLNWLPDELQTLDLTELNVSKNEFESMPDVIVFSFKHLIKMDLSDNMIVELSQLPRCISNLKHINLKGNYLTEVPKWFCSYQSCLKSMDFSLNPIRFTEFNRLMYPQGSVATVFQLEVSNCNLNMHNINFLAYMENLNILNFQNIYNVRRNFFEDVPSNILLKIKNLVELNLSNVGLSVMSETLDCLKNVRVLDLSENSLNYLPTNFPQLSNLQQLNLSNNSLNFLPSDFGCLCKLQHLRLASNRITDLPKSFLSLSQLEYLDLYDNKLESIPELNEQLQGLDLSLNYLNQEYLTGVYENKRWVLLQHYDITNRVCAMKEPIMECSFTSSGSSSRADYSGDECANYEPVILQGEEEIEDWELKSSGSDTDNWDPNSYVPRRKKFTGVKERGEFYFCPGDAHQNPIVPHLRRAKKQCIIYIKGQFDLD